jgi:hypothetical protein
MNSDLLTAASHAVWQMAATSKAATVWRWLLARSTLVPRAERVRLLGVLLLTANVVSFLLTMQTPAMSRPAAPSLLRWELAALASLLIAAAPAVADAWPTSRLRRILQDRS